MTANYFGIHVPSPLEFKEDAYFANAVKTLLGFLLPSFGVAPSSVARLWSIFENSRSIDHWVESAHAYLAPLLDEDQVRCSFEERASRIAAYVKPYLGQTLLDFGCGDGKIANAVASSSRTSIQMTDVRYDDNLRYVPIPFTLFKEDQELPLPQGAFDSILLVSVLHHCVDPLDTMREVRRLLAKGGNVLVIESVYDVDLTPAHLEDGQLGVESFLSLPPTKQLAANVFFEYLFHRIVTFPGEVHLPLSYLPMTSWVSWFAKLGWRAEMKPVGITHRAGPLFHCFYLLRSNQ